jgi:hypothetical protein
MTTSPARGRDARTAAPTMRPHERAEELGHDERRHRGGRDAGEAVGQGSGQRDSRVDEAGRGEPVGRADVGGHHGRCQRLSSSARQPEDDEDQPGRRDQLGQPQQQPRAGWVDSCTSASPKMAFASTAPKPAPRTWAAMYATGSRTDLRDAVCRSVHHAARVTAGLKCAPDTGPNSAIRTPSPSTAAVEFASSCSPTSVVSRVAWIPDPTTTITRAAVPMPSTTALRGNPAAELTGLSHRCRIRGCLQQG